MSAMERFRDLWLCMIGDMSVRYRELRHKEQHGSLNDIERNELETLHERYHMRLHKRGGRI